MIPQDKDAPVDRGLRWWLIGGAGSSWVMISALVWTHAGNVAVLVPITLAVALTGATVAGISAGRHAVYRHSKIWRSLYMAASERHEEYVREVEAR